MSEQRTHWGLADTVPIEMIVAINAASAARNLTVLRALAERFEDHAARWKAVAPDQPQPGIMVEKDSRGVLVSEPYPFNAPRILARFADDRPHHSRSKAHAHAFALTQTDPPAELLAVAARLARTLAGIDEVLDLDRATARCDCESCANPAASRVEGFRCGTCGYVGRPHFMTCNCDAGQSAVHLRCSHGLPLCPACNNGAVDSWQVIRALRVRLAFEPEDDVSPPDRHIDTSLAGVEASLSMLAGVHESESAGNVYTAQKAGKVMAGIDILKRMARVVRSARLELSRWRRGAIAGLHGAAPALDRTEDSK